MHNTSYNKNSDDSYKKKGTQPPVTQQTRRWQYPKFYVRQFEIQKQNDLQMYNSYDALHNEILPQDYDERNENILSNSPYQPTNTHQQQRRPPIAYGEKYINNQKLPPRRNIIPVVPGIHSYAEKAKSGKRIVAGSQI